MLYTKPSKNTSRVCFLYNLFLVFYWLPAINVDFGPIRTSDSFHDLCFCLSPTGFLSWSRSVLFQLFSVYPFISRYQGYCTFVCLLWSLIYLIVLRKKRIYYFVKGIDDFVESFFLFEHPFCENSFKFEHFLFDLSSCFLKIIPLSGFVHGSEFSKQFIIRFVESFEELSSFCLGHTFYLFSDIIIDDMLDFYLVFWRNAFEYRSKYFVIFKIGKIWDISSFFFYIGDDTVDLVYFVLIHIKLRDKTIKILCVIKRYTDPFLKL